MGTLHLGFRKGTSYHLETLCAPSFGEESEKSLQIARKDGRRNGLNQVRYLPESLGFHWAPEVCVVLWSELENDFLERCHKILGSHLFRLIRKSKFQRAFCGLG